MGMPQHRENREAATQYQFSVEQSERKESEEMSDDLFSFDLDIEPELPAAPPTSTVDAIVPLEEWAVEQLAKPAAVFWDIETGPLPEEQLRAVYHEKSAEEFSATCDKRWKPDTVAVKFEEYKASAWDEFVGKAALSATTGRVLLIGTLHGDNFAPILLAEEAECLSIFWTRIEEAIGNKQRIIGHNSNSFDLPFIVRRSWMLGVPVPREVRQGRYWNPLFHDTMEAWSFSAREYTSLNDIAAAFGVGQKTEGVHGRDFYKLWFGTMPTEQWGNPAEQRAKALEYCEQDVRLTAAIAAKMGMV